MYTEEQLQRKYESAKSNHQKWLQLYWEAYRYVTPQRDALNQVLQYIDAGINNNQQIYSNVAPMACIFRANKLTRMLMPDNQEWGSLGVSPELIDNNTLSYEDITNAQKTQYRYLGESNLAQQIQDSFVDEGVGSGALWIENPTEEEPLKFQSVPGFAVMPEYYAGNTVRDCWYIMSASAQWILDSYQDLGITEKAVLTAKPDEIYWIVRGVIYDPDDNDSDKKWRIIDMLHFDPQKGDFGIIFDENYTYRKLIYFRDRVRPGEVAGRGPAIEYLPTIERLNVLERLRVEAAEIRAFPPTEVDDQKVNLDMLTNFAGSSVPKGSFGRSLELPPSPEVDALIEKLEQDIQKGFSVDPLGNLNQPVRTAAEVNERIDAAKVNTTIDVSRLLQESSKPVFETCFAILLEMDLIPNGAKFKKAIQADGKAVVFSYQNPLGNIEKNNNMMKLGQTFQFSQQYMGPEAWMAQFDIQQLQDFIRDNSGLEPDIFKPGAELVQLIGKILQQTQGGPQQPNQALPQSATAPAQPQALTQEGITI